MVRRLFLFIGVILVIMLVESRTKPQIVAPECFEKENCRVPIQEGYCDVEYDCILGRCYSEQIKCPEICYGEEDEDFDGLIDCKDPDCFNSPHCACEKASFNDCVVGKCYCASGIPRWAVAGEGIHYCVCI